VASFSSQVRGTSGMESLVPGKKLCRCSLALVKSSRMASSKQTGSGTGAAPVDSPTEGAGTRASSGGVASSRMVSGDEGPTALVERNGST